MSLVKNYISTLRTNKLALENEESKRTFLNIALKLVQPIFFLVGIVSTLNLQWMIMILEKAYYLLKRNPCSINPH